MKLSTVQGVVLGGFVASPQRVAALAPGDAEAMYDAFNSAFLTTSGSDAFYKAGLDNAEPDETWSGSLDILGAEDAYDRTGDDDKKTLVNNLLTTWLNNTPPPWDWDGWNDDIGWFTMALIRGYQITGTQDFLDQAIYGFDYAFGRGWDTEYNDGGIWEQNPEYLDDPSEANKEALSNNSLGKVACLIYQSTNDNYYLDRCRQIYDWVWNHLFEKETGLINAGVNRDGSIITGPAAYNQGTFLDYANLVYKITGDSNVYDDAMAAIEYGRNNLTVDGIFTNTADYLNTWADEMARGVGNFVRDNQLWDTYYPWMVQNAASILENRRSDLGITWNGWDQPTPNDNSLSTNTFVSAMAWLQYVPETKPNEIGGIHVITDRDTKMAVDSADAFGNGRDVVQSKQSNGQRQRWLFSQNPDASWNIINLSTWQALQCPQGRGEDNIAMVQSQPTRDSNQRWWVDQQSDGSYKIWNQSSGKVLNGISGGNGGNALVQRTWSGESQQRWVLQ
ncbi:hypothetical protein FQN54_005592 [Arachnomyces sp. PD_36]|nr:hypothetical protein FQN54_005592 [Arachnomyces sp. PD_36]